MAIMPMVLFLRRIFSGGRSVSAGKSVTLNSISKVLKILILSLFWDNGWSLTGYSALTIWATKAWLNRSQPGANRDKAEKIRDLIFY